MKYFLQLVVIICSAILIGGCETLDTLTKVGTTVAVATGQISASQAESINKTSSAIGKAIFDKLTAENEYYIGRSVGATILKSYKPYDNAEANRYLNLMGQTLAASCDRPETFGGYHFLLIDTDEINAFAAPGGLIFVSRGLVKCCKDEDSLAAVLAHEVAHVQLMHGLKSIKASRFKDAAFTAGIEAGKNLGGEALAQFTTVFENTLNDITSTLVNSGYSRSTELEADAAAITIMKRLGYNPAGLRDMLTEMEKRLTPSKGFGKTHPDPKIRIDRLGAAIRTAGPVTQPAGRQVRFKTSLAGI
jgi:predicted Zn-dependent protease